MSDAHDNVTSSEPDEPDPETKYAPDIPSVEAPDPSEVEVPPEIASAFWSVVIAVNVGVLLASLGVLFIYFEGRWQLGGAGVVLGVATLAYGYLKYRVAEPLTQRRM